MMEEKNENILPSEETDGQLAEEVSEACESVQNLSDPEAIDTVENGIPVEETDAVADGENAEAEPSEGDEDESSESGEETLDRPKKKKCFCSICLCRFESENPDVLTVGGFGNPRYLCPDCAALLDRASLSHEPEEIEEAIRKAGETFAKSGNDDEVTLGAFNGCLAAAAERKKKIEEGSYDFADDERSDVSELDEIPEELRETEEDAELDRIEEEAEKKADKIQGIVALCFFAIAIVFVVLKFFVFKK